MNGESMLGRWLAVLVALPFALTACVSASETDTAGGPAPQATLSLATAGETVGTTEPAAEPITIVTEPGYLVWVHDQEPASLHSDDPENPADVASWIRQGLTEGLFGIDRNNTYYPELLAGEPTLEQLNSGTIVIDYRLRDGLRWSDGTPLTAADVAYTHQMIIEGCETELDRSIVDSTNQGCEYDLTSRFGYELVTDFEVLNDTEFRVTMASFFGGWRGLYDQVMAAHAYGPTARDVNANLRRWQGEAGILPSSGPLVFERWDPGNRIVLARNDAYHGSVSPDATTEGPAAVEGVELVFIGDLDARIELLLTGQAHVMMTPPEPGLAVLTEDETFTVASVAGPVFEHWSLNLLNPHLAKTEVREALAYAIDKGEIVSTLYAPIVGPALPAEGLGNTFWMTNQPHYEDHQGAYAGNNLGAAAAALEAAGYALGGDGIWTHPVDGRLSLRAGTTGGVPLRDRQLELVAEQLERAGIEIVIDSRPGGLFLTEGPFAPAALAAASSKGREGDRGLWDIAQFAWSSGPWPGTISGVYRSGSSSNPYGFGNPEYDVAGNECDAATVDDERAACYNRLDRFVTTLEEGPDGLFVIPLTQKPRFFGWSSTVEAGAVAPDVVRGGPLVNVVDYRLGQ